MPRFGKAKTQKRTNRLVGFSKNGIVKIHISMDCNEKNNLKIGDNVIITTLTKKSSAFSKQRKVSEVVAHGSIKNILKDEIIIDSSQSPIISKNAWISAIANQQPMSIKVLK